MGYFDEFDVKFDSGYQQRSLFIPTRRTTYEQSIDCSNHPDSPCPTVDNLTKGETIYMADIEDFTLLIDHSMVSAEVGIKDKSWDMIGFVNPCGRGKEVEEKGLARKVAEASQVADYVELGEHHEAKKEEEEEEEDCSFMPVHRLDAHMTKKEKNQRDRGFAMWKDEWTKTLLPFWPFEGNASVEAHKNKAHFTKIENGDIVKVEELLRLLGPDAALDNKKKKNRFDGMVIIIDIHYSNWKENTWPNRVEPAYFYSFSLAPASEYKIMQDTTRQVITDRALKKRRLYDYHGIFILIQQHGDMGKFSWEKAVLLAVGALLIESVYRSIFTLLILNCNCMVHRSVSEEELEKEEEELQDLIVTEYKLGDKEPLKQGQKEGIPYDRIGGKTS